VAVAITESSGSLVQRTFTLAVAAVIEKQSGNLGAARELSREVSDRLQRFPESHPAMRHSEAMSRGIAAQIDVAAGDVSSAQEGAEAAFAAAVQTDDMPIVAAMGVIIADLAVAVGRDTVAADVLGAAASLRGTPDPTGPDIARLTELLRCRLGDEEFTAAVTRGEALDRQAAIERLRTGLSETAEATASLVASGASPVAGEG